MGETAFTIRGGAHPHVAGLAGPWGGFRLAYEVMNANHIFSVMLKDRPFEICEFSLANFLKLKAEGQEWLAALPIFPNRAFRHGTLTVRRDSDLHDPSRLAGLRVGVEDYSMSAAVWVRGLLADEYGVSDRDIRWVTAHQQRFNPPPHACIEYDDTPLEEMLALGRVDAIIGLNLADSRRPKAERRLRPLLPDPQQAEREYYQSTGIYPINHCVAIRADVLQTHPEVAEAVSQAYAQAKAQAYQAQTDAARPIWANCAPHPAFADAARDPLEYGLTGANRVTVQNLAQHLLRQGLIGVVPDVDALFLDTPTLQLAQPKERA